MRVNLKIKQVAVGYSQLYGKSHTRIKAVSRREECTSIHNQYVDQIIEKDGFFRQEYRLLKESQGYIFRDTINDSGINGHHSTMKKAIVEAYGHVTIHLDEEFSYTHNEGFKIMAQRHQNREKGCQHLGKFEVRGFYWCPDCGTDIRKEVES